jgi:DNA (cytosine-5)-methyltransferase 1
MPLMTSERRSFRNFRRNARLSRKRRVLRLRLRKRERTPAEEKPRFIAVDFFCGAGGTTRGLIDAGGYVLAGIDKDERCRRTYIDNNANLTWDRRPPLFLAKDVFEQDADHPAGEHHLIAQELDMLIGRARARFPGVPLMFAICAPCQPFTTLSSKEAMSRKRLEKRRRDSNLLHAASLFVRRFKPELVISENVAGIRDPRFGGIWSDFKDELEGLGYATGTDTVCVSKFGVAQRRKRSILLAALREARILSDRFADLLNGALIVPRKDSDAPALTVAEAIGHLPPLGAGEAHPKIPNHRTRSLSELNIKRIAAAPPGMTNRYMGSTPHGDLSLECHRRVVERSGSRGFNDVYTRMRPDGPAPTITTRCHSISNGRFGHYDTRQHRGISLREAAALQSFRDDYIFYPTERIEPVARMIGNAVPPRLAKFFADYLVASLDR